MNIASVKNTSRDSVYLVGDLNNEEKGYDFSKFKSKYWYIPHMYGIELPKYITDKKK